MIEAVPAGNRWTWRMICAFGRVLAYTAESWPTDREAFAEAKRYRAELFGRAEALDLNVAAI